MLMILIMIRMLNIITIITTIIVIIIIIIIIIVNFVNAVVIVVMIVRISLLGNAFLVPRAGGSITTDAFSGRCLISFYSHIVAMTNSIFRIDRATLAVEHFLPTAT